MRLSLAFMSLRVWMRSVLVRIAQGERDDDPTGDFDDVEDAAEYDVTTIRHN